MLVTGIRTCSPRLIILVTYDHRGFYAEFPYLSTFVVFMVIFYVPRGRVATLVYLWFIVEQDASSCALYFIMLISPMYVDTWIYIIRRACARVL